MDGPIIGYVIISDNPLMWLQGPIYKFGAKKCLFFINFTRFVWFFWDLGLTFLDIPKDVFFPEILVLSNTFGFLAVNLALKCTKTVNFGCIPFDPKFKILKDFSDTIFVLLEEYLWSKSQQDRTIFGRARPNIPKKEPFHKCWINTKNSENF